MKVQKGRCGTGPVSRGPVCQGCWLFSAHDVALLLRLRQFADDLLRAAERGDNSPEDQHNGDKGHNPTRALTHDSTLLSRAVHIDGAPTPYSCLIHRQERSLVVVLDALIQKRAGHRADNAYWWKGVCCLVRSYAGLRKQAEVAGDGTGVGAGASERLLERGDVRSG